MGEKILDGRLAERELVCRGIDCSWSCVHRYDNIQKDEWATYEQLEKVMRSEFHRVLSDQVIGEYRKKDDGIKAESILADYNDYFLVYAVNRVSCLLTLANQNKITELYLKYFLCVTICVQIV